MPKLYNLRSSILQKFMVLGIPFIHVPQRYTMTLHRSIGGKALREISQNPWRSD